MEVYVNGKIFIIDEVEKVGITRGNFNIPQVGSKQHK